MSLTWIIFSSNKTLRILFLETTSKWQTHAQRRRIGCEIRTAWQKRFDIFSVLNINFTGISHCFVINLHFSWMDPRIAWCPPEHCVLANDIWTRIWEAEIGVDNMSLNNSNPNLDHRPREYIPLDYSINYEYKNAVNNRQSTSFKNTQNLYKRKRDNKASTYGLNHSSNKQHLRDGRMTPWKPRDKKYTLPGHIG